MSKQRQAISNTPMKNWCADNEIPQRQLADVLNLTVATVNGKLNGWIAWQPRDLVIIHNVYGLSSDFVLGISEQERSEDKRGAPVPIHV